MKLRLPESLYPRYRCALLACVCLLNATAGGLIFGFSGLASLVIRQGIETDEAKLRLISSTAISFCLFAPIFLGLVMHNFGPRCTTCFGLCLTTIGMFLISQHHLLIGSALIAIGGPAPHVGGLHMSGLFVKHRAFALSLISSSVPLSFLVFPAFNLSTLALTPLAISYGLFLSCLTLITLMIWPDRPISPCTSDNSSSGDHTEPSSPSITINKTLSSPPINGLLRSTPRGLWTREVYPKLRQQMRSWSYFCVAMYAPLAVLFCNSIVILVKVQIRHFISDAPDPLLEETLVNCFGLMMPLGLVMVPVFGFILDHFGVASGAIFQHGLLLTYAGLALLLPYLPPYMIMFTFLLQGCSRQVTFCFIFQLLTLDFSPEYYGVLMGMVFTVAALLSLAHNHIVFCLLGGNIALFNRLQFTLLLFMCFLPLHWCSRGNVKSARKTIEQDADDIELADGRTTTTGDGSTF